MNVIYAWLIGLLMGAIFGLILHEKLFPENKTVNDITNKFKKSTINVPDILDTINNNIPVQNNSEPRKGFFRRIFKRKNRP